MMNRKMLYQQLALISIAYCFIPLLSAGQSYSPAANIQYPVQVYWGDTHLHTNLSLDANGMGNKTLGLDEAYQFAKGFPITTENGDVAQLTRPLDFLVIADHAVNMGLLRAAYNNDSILLESEKGRNLHKTINSVQDSAKDGYFWEWFEDDLISEKLQKTVWSEVTTSADRHNSPGNFSAFIGFEWTSSWSAENPASIHRVVVFSDGKEKANEIMPFSRLDSQDPEDLWEFMEGYEREYKGEVLAIPHNSNLAVGQMFSLQDANGDIFDEDYIKRRSRWEPLVEVTQYKGDSETHPLLSPNDEFADYETWIGWEGKRIDTPLSQEQIKNLPKDYVRSVLKLGLNEQSRVGLNPFKVGLIGSTDSHTSLAASDEDNYWGKTAVDNPSSTRMEVALMPWAKKSKAWEFASSGYAAVWAQENTREALFASMKRKEVYGTTGPRITVRFFGGWNYKSNDAFKPNLATIGYKNGVPMGGDLTAAPANQSPAFLIRAVKDPDGANLDRVQVIKGWHDEEGQLHEKIYNVALSDDRKENRKGKVKPVGNTVDIPDASYTNTIGDPELAVVWEDPDFDANELAFYYVRVLEIPTPRWTAYDAKYFKLKNLPKEIPMVTQERAYTSPIWYTP